MKSQLFVYLRVLAIVALGAAVLTGIHAVEQPMHPGPAAVCIASALVLGMSLIAMAILQLSDKNDTSAK